MGKTRHSRSVIEHPGEKIGNGFAYKSWWQTQSELCGVPDGLSYGLDKDRSNRIKALGNSIVPEIAYEIAKAILVAENERTHGQIQRHRSNQHGIGK